MMNAAQTLMIAIVTVWIYMIFAVVMVYRDYLARKEEKEQNSLPDQPTAPVDSKPEP